MHWVRERYYGIPNLALQEFSLSWTLLPHMCGILALLRLGVPIKNFSFLLVCMYSLFSRRKLEVQSSDTNLRFLDSQGRF